MYKFLRPAFLLILFAAVFESQGRLKAEVINPPASSSGSVDLNENSGQKYPNGSTSYTLTPVNGTPEAYFPYGVTYYVLEKGTQHDSKIIFDVLYGSSDPTMFLYKGLFIPETINYSNVLDQNDDTGQDQHPGGRTSCQTSPAKYCPLVEFSVGSGSKQINYDTLYSVVGSVYSYSSSLPTPFNLNVTDGILVAEPDLGELSEYLIGIDKSGSQFNTVSEVVNGDIFPVWQGGVLKASSAYAANVGFDFSLTSLAGNTFDNNNLVVNLTGRLSDYSGERGSINFRGLGATVLSGSNTYSGLTAVEQGSLEIKSSGSLGSTSGGTLVKEGAILEVNVSGSVAEPIELRDGGRLQATKNSPTLSGALELTGASPAQIDVGTNRSLKISSRISGDQGFTKTGSGSLELKGSGNNFGPSIQLKGGSLRVDSNLPSSINLSLDVGTIYYPGSSDSLGSLDGMGDVVLSTGKTLSVSSGDFSGSISGSNASLDKIGSGTLVLEGANDYSGSTTVQQGTLQISTSDALSGTSSVTVESGGTLNLGGTTGTQIPSLLLNGGSRLLDGSISTVNGSTVNGSVDFGASLRGGSVDITGQLDFKASGQIVDSALLNVDSTISLGGREQTIFELNTDSNSTVGNGSLITRDFNLADSAQLNVDALSGTEENDQILIEGEARITQNPAQPNKNGLLASIDLKGGDDVLVVENGGSLTIPDNSIIDGGDLGIYSLEQGYLGEINVYWEKRGENPAVTNVRRDQLKNFTLFNVSGDWESGFDEVNEDTEAAECRFIDGEYSVNGVSSTCLLLLGSSTESKQVSIDGGGSLRAGVVSFASGSTDSAEARANQFNLVDGSFSSPVLQGAPGATNNITLGSSDRANTQGLFAVKYLEGFDSLTQASGNWIYDIKSYGEGDSPLTLTVQAGDVVVDKIGVASDLFVGDNSLGFAHFNAIDVQSELESTITNKGELIVDQGITGNASLVTASGATTDLSGTSTHSGPTVVDSGGLLRAGNANAFSTQSNFNVGGTMDLGGYEQQIQSLILNSGTIEAGDSADSSAVLTVESDVLSRSGTINAELSGSKGLIAESGTTEINIPSTYTGFTQIQEGATLLASGEDVLSDQSAFQIEGELRLNADNTISAIAGNGDVDLDGSKLTLAIGSGADQRFEGRFLGANVDANSVDAASLLKTGAGTLVLKELNSTYSGGWFTGDLTVQEGVLEVEKFAGDCDPNEALSGGSRCRTLRIADGATVVNSQQDGTIGLNFDAPIGSDQAGRFVVQNGRVTLLQRQAPLGSGLFEVQKDAVLKVSSNSGNRGYLGNWDVQNDGQVIFSRSPNQLYSGSISGSGSVQYDAASGRTLTFSNTHSYSGDTTVSGDGFFVVKGSLPDTTNVSVSGSAVYEVANSDLIQSLTINNAAGMRIVDGASLSVEQRVESLGSSENQSSFITGEGSLITPSLNNSGYVDLNLLVLQDGAEVFELPFRDREFQASLQNYGDINLGQLDASGSKQSMFLVNAANASLTADSIVLGSADDVLKNAGTLSASDINLGDGNDLLVTLSSIDLDRAVVNGSDGVIDGGNPFLGVNSAGGYAGEINLFWNADSAAPESVTRDQLKNFALIKWSADRDWEIGSIDLPGVETPTACLVAGERIFSSDDTCLLIKGTDAGGKTGNTIRIQSDGVLNAGVVSLGRDQQNTIALEQGDLNAIAIDAGSVATDQILLGSREVGGTGSLNLGLLSGFEQILQLGGDWSYDIKSYGEGLWRSAKPITLIAEGGSVTIEANPALTNNDPLGEATFSAITSRASDAAPLEITNKGTLMIDGDADEGITGSVNLNTTAGANTFLSGTNSYTGLTTIGGSLTASTPNALSPNSDYKVVSGGELLLEGGDQQIAQLMGSGDVDLQSNELTLLTPETSVDIDFGVVESADRNSQSSVSLFSGSILGMGVVIKQGDGVQDFDLANASASSAYSGDTVIKQGTLRAAGANAFSQRSSHIIQSEATLDLGDSLQTLKEAINSGTLEDGSLVAEYLWNLSSGDVNLDSIEVDALLNQGSIETSGAIQSERLFNLASSDLTAQSLSITKGDSEADFNRAFQAGVVNSGSIDLAGDLEFVSGSSASSTGDQRGFALLNRADGSMSIGELIFSSENDLLVNRGSLATTQSSRKSTSSDSSEWESSINLGLGNDLIVSDGQFSLVPDSVIDGGEAIPKDVGTGIDVYNVFYQRSGESGVELSQLKNFAAVKFPDADWIFPQGGECLVDSDVYALTSDSSNCVAYVDDVTQPEVERWNLLVANGADIETGVIALDGLRGGDRVAVSNGSLSAMLLAGDNDGTAPDEVHLGYRSRAFGRTAARGSLDVGAILDYGGIYQHGGVWSYDIGFGATPLTARGVVAITGSDGDSDASSAVFASISDWNDGSRLLVRNDGDLRVTGIVDGASVVNTGVLEIGSLTSGGMSGERKRLWNRGGELLLSGASDYTGVTLVDGGRLAAGNAYALSAASRTTVGRGGVLDLGGVEQRVQTLRTLSGKREGSNPGVVENGDLFSTDVLNAGVMDVGNLTIESGSRRVVGGTNVQLQAGLLNAGRLSTTGDLRFVSNGTSADVELGQLLLNSVDGVMEISGDVSFGGQSDLLVNRGELNVSGDDGIQLGGGNDVVLTDGVMRLNNDDSNVVDGGEELDIAARTGLNLFSYRGGRDGDAGVNENQLVNFAAVQLPDVNLNLERPVNPIVDSGRPEWTFPQGGECRVEGDGREFSENAVCVGVVGDRTTEQSLTVREGAVLQAGVVALGYQAPGVVNVENGELRVGLLDGSGEKGNEINLGGISSRDGLSGSGYFKAGVIEGFEQINQLGGVWRYDIGTGALPLVGRGVARVDAGDSAVFSTVFGTRSLATNRLLLVNEGELTVGRQIDLSLTDRQAGDQEGRIVNASVINSGVLEIQAGMSGERKRLWNRGGETLLSGESDYTGVTLVDGGRLTAGNAYALSAASRTTVGRGGVLDLGGVEQRVQTLRTLSGKREGSNPGVVENGDLFSTDVLNAGVMDVGNLTIESGSRRVVGGTDVQLQAGLLNSGRLSTTGDLRFVSNGTSADVELGQLLLNSVDGVMEISGDVSFGGQSDLLVNRGELNVSGDDGIHLGGGNDVVLTDGVMRLNNDGSNVVDGGEELDIPARTGLNVFSYRGGRDGDAGVNENQLVNFAAVQLPDVNLTIEGPVNPIADSGRPEWMFPQGGACPVEGDGIEFKVEGTKKETVCVGVVGYRTKLQSLTVRGGAVLKAGVVALGYEAPGVVNVEEGELRVGLLDGSGEKGNEINLGGVSNGEGFSGSGYFKAGAIDGFEQINQLGGEWRYDIGTGALPLVGQGVARVDAEDSAVFASVSLASSRETGRFLLVNEGELTIGDPLDPSDSQRSLNSNEGVITNASVLNQGVLAIQGGLRTTEKALRNRLINRGGDVVLGGSSDYAGLTWIQGGSVTAANQRALSQWSRTLVGRDGALDLGGAVQVVDAVTTAPDRSIAGIGLDSQFESAGLLKNGSLITSSFRNAGEAELDHLVVLRGGPEASFDVDLVGLTVSVDGAEDNPVLQRDQRQRRITRQIGLTNSGELDVTGGIVFQSPDQEGGEAQLLRNRYGASLRAGSIQFGSGDDVLINRGALTLVDANPSDGVARRSAVHLGGGNDLILDRGDITLPLGRVINGGEAFNNDLENPDGLNIYRYASQQSSQQQTKNIELETDQSSLALAQFTNFAAVNLGDGWIFPQGNDCRVDSTGREITDDQLCVGVIGLAGEEGSEKALTVTDGALLRAGVIALDASANRDQRVESTNTIRIDNGAEVNALLIEGADVELSRVRDQQGVSITVESLGDQPDLIELGSGGGALKASAIEGVDRIQQEGGTWELHIPYSSALTLEGQGELVLEATTEFFGDPEPGQLQLDRIEGSGLTIRSAGEFTVDSGIGGDVDLTITDGITAIGGESDYSGPTLISGGQLLALADGALSPASPITVESGGELVIDTTEQVIPQLEGSGRVSLAGASLVIGSESAAADETFSFEGTMQGGGSLVKAGPAQMQYSGESLELSSLMVLGGQLDIRQDNVLKGFTDVAVQGGELDLEGFDQQLGNVTLAPGGMLKIGELFDSQSVDNGKVGFISVQGLSFTGGQLEVDIEQDFGKTDTAPYLDFISGGSGLTFDEASYDADAIAMVIDVVDFEPEDGLDFTIFGGDVDEAELDQLVSKTAFIREEGDSPVLIAQFAGLNKSLDVPGYDVRLLSGSLKLSITTANTEDLLAGRDPSDLPGCQGLEALCKETLSGLDNDRLPELPIITWGELAQTIGSGLLPRNVDAGGRGLFNFNNLLVDTVFERLPIRQFRPVQVAASAPDSSPDEATVEPMDEAQPVRGLWSGVDPLDQDQAETYLNQQLASGEPEHQDQTIELQGVTVQEDPSLTAELADREGVRAWFRGFGGDTGPTETTAIANDYYANAGGSVLGVDLSVSPSVQLGVFATYGNVSVNQLGSQTGGGSWSSDGWGGGFRADWWTDNFYVQGLVAASGFEGNQTRSIVRITDDFGGKTASGSKSATSYAAALRLGAPFQAGNLLLEPQFTAAWTQNQEDGFTETGAGNFNLRYGSRTTNYLQTELGMKLSLPMNSGERGLWVPNLRVAWLGDWNQNNEDQTIGYAFTNKTVDVSPVEDDQNGVLIEAGLDYTMANINSGSWKLYVRGGAEVWGGERGTDWRASGGVTWQF